MTCGKAGRGRLRAWIEQALGRQLLLEALQLQGQLTQALGSNHIHRYIECAAWFVEGNAPVSRNRGAVGQHFNSAAVAEHNCLEHGVLVFQVKVGVAGRGDAEVGNFAFDPQVSQEGVAFQ